ncbi:transcriptional regulator [Congregibacter brevis]|uniref:Transcriptional regulator n=1 Tax=Congregibacter brevis TaxID=3081201 RepID=A0ABZ0IDJ2_9GAMM|nr:transcriptional regulator [Congregibacter sp. IMCC45268]
MAEFRIDDLDDVIHGRIRLGVMAYLIGAERAAFKDLAGQLQASDGNLSVHLRKLEDAGYISIEKRFAGRKPLTEAVITEAGRHAFARYLDSISKLLPSQK